MGPNPKSSFQCANATWHIFGFIDEYSMVTYRLQDTLICKDDNDALFCTAGASAGKVVLSKLLW